ncbi:MAG: FAD-dependent oxidoreductase [Anaerolineae bacterium]|nr:FAD-dependent oxidoreductase [Anaerolineae bacterium]
MREVDVLIVGGSVAGSIAAVTARRNYPEASILVVRPEPRTVVPCGIPYLFGTLGSCELNLTPADRLPSHRVDLLVDRVSSIDRTGHQATTEGGETIAWRRLILATGSTPIVPPIPGSDLPGVFRVVKQVEYLEQMLEAMRQARDVVFVGCGLIGLELADEFRKQGLNVTVVEMMSRCLELVFDEEVSRVAEEEIQKRGIGLRTATRLTAVEGQERAEAVVLSSGERLPADLVVFGIGVHPNVELAQAAGLHLVEGAGVWVDRFMRTSDPSIFAAGDCAAKSTYLTGALSGVKLASVASAEARVAGANLFDLRREFPGVVGAYSTKIGDVAMGLAGVDEKGARALAIDCVTGSAQATDKHPGAMPGATMTRVKLVFRRHDGLLIGGQVVGGDTTGEMVNTIAVMIQSRMTAHQVASIQVGTHPALTASPGHYQLFNAAEMALMRMG